MTLKTPILFLWWGRKLRCVTGPASKWWLKGSYSVTWISHFMSTHPFLLSVYTRDLSHAPKYTLCSASAVALLPHIVTGWEAEKVLPIVISTASNYLISLCKYWVFPFIILIQCSSWLLIPFNMAEYYLDVYEQAQTKTSPGTVPVVKWYSGPKDSVQECVLLLCKFTHTAVPRLLSKQQNEQFLV